MAKTKKSVVTIISTDWHLKEDNIEIIKDLVEQKCKLAQKLKVDTVFCLGDIFDTRAGQKVNVLIAFSEILAIFELYKITLWAFPGNHDKQNYESDGSYVEPFRYHPYFKYIPKAGGVPMKNLMFHLLPFYKEGLWTVKYKELLDYIGKFDKTVKHILLSHIAVNGSVNNDGSQVSCGISVTDFKQFDLVLLGHYHNEQQVGGWVFHIPSIRQNNFGENTRKGFTIVYDDCSFDLHKSDFTEFEKVVIDYDNVSKEELEKLVKKYANSKHFVRFEFVGSQDKVKLINKEELSSLGIDVKIKVKEIEATIEYAHEEVKEYNRDNIIEEFREFCEEKGKNFETGIEYLKQKLGI